MSIGCFTTSYAFFDPNASGGVKSEEKYREWELQSQNEYRFELAPNTSIGIKVRVCRSRRRAPEFAPARGWVCRVFWNRTHNRDIVPVRGRVQSRHLHPQRVHVGDESLARCQTIASEPYHPSPYVYGEPATEYISGGTAMGHYQSASILFEQMRVLSLAIADEAPLDGPNPQNDPATPPHILALGPENSGKTTLYKTLINYAVRGEPWGHGEWSPILVNVDPGDVGDLGVRLRQAASDDSSVFQGA